MQYIILFHLAVTNFLIIPRSQYCNLLKANLSIDLALQVEWISQPITFQQKVVYLFLFTINRFRFLRHY